MEQQRRPHQNEEKSAGDHGNAVLLEEMLQRRKSAKADRGGFARRIEQRQHRRYERDAAEEGDQHAATGNEPELRKDAQAGLQRGKKSHGGGRGGQGERIAHLAGGPSQGLSQVMMFMPLGTIAHAELNAEV